MIGALTVAWAAMAAMPAAAVTGNVAGELGNNCTAGGFNIGITFDTSSSIEYHDFVLAYEQILNFLSSSSGYGENGTPNNNLYYLSNFGITVSELGGARTATPTANSAGPFHQYEAATRDSFANLVRTQDGTDLALGLRDLQAAFSESGLTSGYAVIVTDGNCCSVDPLHAPCCLAEDLTTIGDEMRAAGFTVIAVGIGNTIDEDMLKTFVDNPGTPGIDDDPHIVLAELYNGPNNTEHRLLERICD